MCAGLDPCSVKVCPQEACRVNPICVNGQCFSSPAQDSTICDDGNVLTLNDKCVSGQCVGSVNKCASVVCNDLPCKKMGACDPALGVCVYQTLLSNIVCDDGKASTTGDQCVSGECLGINLCLNVECNDQCAANGSCDPKSGKCVYKQKLTGDDCDDGDDETVIDVCMNGACIENKCVNSQGIIRQCPDEQCRVKGVCNYASGIIIPCSSPCLCINRCQCLRGE